MIGQTYRGGILSSNGLMVWVDDEDFDNLVVRSWYVEKNGYVRRWPHISMHREILGLGKGDHHGGVDHINGNKLDNQKANLRVATPSQNQWNRKTLSSHGVYYDGRYKTRPWRGSVKRFGVAHHTKFFRTKEEAMEARRVLSLQLHGEYSGHLK